MKGKLKVEFKCTITLKIKYPWNMSMEILHWGGRKEKKILWNFLNTKPFFLDFIYFLYFQWCKLTIPLSIHKKICTVKVPETCTAQNQSYIQRVLNLKENKGVPTVYHQRPVDPRAIIRSTKNGSSTKRFVEDYHWLWYIWLQYSN